MGRKHSHFLRDGKHRKRKLLMIANYYQKAKPPTLSFQKSQHTFASHFMMNGGNILTLQKVLGHSDIKMTMCCARLAPDFLEEATRLNPLAAKNES